MSALERVRNKYKTSPRGTDKGDKSPSVSSVSASPTDIQNKKAIDRDRERRRDAVTAMLEARPGIKRAFLADPLPDGAGRVTLAVRGIGTCELLIPAGRFDGLAIMRLFDELEPQPGAADNSTDPVQ
jgi:hypothetical protein